MRRKSRITVTRCISTIAVAGLSATQAAACFVPAPFVVEDIKAADVVFEGTVLNYDYVGCPREPLFAECHSLIDVQVHNTLKGEERDQWTLYWGNSIYGVPEEWEGEKRRLFAGKWVDGSGLPVRSGSATTVPSVHSELLQVLQAPCSDPFFLPADGKTIKEVRALVDEAPSTESKND